MQATLNLTQIIEQTQNPATRVVWLYLQDSLSPARVDVVNGSRQKFVVSDDDIDTLISHFRQAGWTVSPAVSSLGFTARRISRMRYIATEKSTRAVDDIPFRGAPSEALDNDDNGVALHVDF